MELTKITRVPTATDAMVDSAAAHIAPSPFATVIDTDAPRALWPAIESANRLFAAFVETLGIVSPERYELLAPVGEWNPRQEQPIALVARLEDGVSTGVFMSKKLGVRPALSIGPKWLELEGPIELFSAVGMAVGDWVNLYVCQSNETPKFTVDANGYCRNRSRAKHAEWYEKWLGVDAITGPDGRYSTAVMSVRPLGGKFTPEDGAPYRAKQFFAYCEAFGPVSESVHGLERIVDKKQSKPGPKNPRRAWACRCTTSESDKPKTLKRYAPAGQWLRDFCFRCGCYLRPFTSSGDDSCTMWKDKDGQARLQDIAKGDSDEERALANLRDYDKRSSEANDKAAVEFRKAHRHEIEKLLARFKSEAELAEFMASVTQIQTES